MKNLSRAPLLYAKLTGSMTVVNINNSRQTGAEEFLMADKGVGLLQDWRGNAIRKFDFTILVSGR